MPGILPMKVIKVGNSSQSRIAQACDRCRSKKIRCDGIRPCCSQCANVGFECKTSDKLSRRAFPRGYTESLEERVRGLEAEVRELKGLLDEKDEKIDLLSKIHAFTPPERRVSLSPPATNISTLADEDCFQVQQSAALAEDGKPEPFFVGASSGRAFVDAFKWKLQQKGKPCSDIVPHGFFVTEHRHGKPTVGGWPSDVPVKTPPRLLSDQLINIFFQEWAPLFPVLHRPTFLKLYDNFVRNPESVQNDKHAIAQLNLVFGIAALSKPTCGREDIASFETQWHAALNAAKSEMSLVTLQCLILAQIHSICNHDYDTLLEYKGLAVLLCHRLGLNQSQRRFSLGALTRETRKRVFWTGYTLDRFSAAVLGVPMLLKEEDIHTEYPADIDDENVTEKGFLPTLPGESTKLSSALALFRASRVLTHVLEQNYPASVTYELSLQKIGALQDELDEWRQNLAPHLRLEFVQDKPSTNVVGNRGPILSLAYFYIRSLIHRPALGCGLGSKASSSLVALADSCKHIIQIIQLLDERRMSFSLCLNRSELLMLSGFGLLYQALDLDEDGRLIQDNQRLVGAVVDMLTRTEAIGASEFKKLVPSVLRTDKPKYRVRRTSKNSSSFEDAKITTDCQFATTSTAQSLPRRATLAATAVVPPHATSPIPRNDSIISLSSISSARSEPAFPVRNCRPVRICNSMSPQDVNIHSFDAKAMPNLDYFPITTNSMLNSLPATSNCHDKDMPPQMQTANWEKLLAVLDGGNRNIYDGIYGGPSPEAILSPYLSNQSPVAPVTCSPFLSDTFSWSPPECPPDFGTPGMFATPTGTAKPQPPQSVFSLSDESLTSGGEDFAVPSTTSTHGIESDDGGLSSGEIGEEGYKGILMPNLGDEIFGSVNDGFRA